MVNLPCVIGQEVTRVDQAEFEQVASLFKTFHRRFSGLFGYVQTKERSAQYLQGLLVQRSERRNAENLAEAVDGATARTLQRFLSESPWEHEPLIDALQVFVGERLNTSDGVFILDETGVAKQGQRSVGVARQYCGTLGKVGNCQVGVFLAYASARGHALIDMRLFLPQEWSSDAARCEKAGVPIEIAFQSKPQLGCAMLRQAQTRGAFNGRWVTADSLYGSSPDLRDALQTDGWHYVMDVRSTERLFTTPTETAVPTWSGRGRKPTQPHLVEGASPAQGVAELVTAWPAAQWQTLTVGEGAQGPRTYQFAAVRGWECRDGLPGRETWLLARRNLDGSELKYALSNAPAPTPLVRLAQVATTRWCIETEIQTEKGQVGLDEYEVRSWRGWHHHMALALLAGAFLLQLQQDWGEKDAPADAPSSRTHTPRGAAQTHLDVARPMGLVGRHPTPQRARHPLPSQTSAS